jgi:lipopolysaccharide transport system ATP-binding protein
MSNTILKIENLSKQYRLGTIGTGTISHDLNRWWYKVRGKEDPFLKIGDVNDRATKGTSDYVWALKDINFKVQQGEVLGIIGKNGAGKSTLLKILSKVTSPTTGSIKSKGRIASLLEVGTGFHPELTGRENIFLNGAILGMTKKEINEKLEEIISFAGVERYIDTPVKRYSSGMKVRLAFSVAAHLEPDILVVDEVLAVGDAEFQKKAIGKMQDISKGEGRTVLFVSHNMAAVKKLCTSGILLEKGKIQSIGNIDKILNVYQKEGKKILEYSRNSCNKEFYFKRISLLSDTNNFYSEDEIPISFEIESNSSRYKNKFILVRIIDHLDQVLFTCEKELELNKKEYKLRIPAETLVKGSYKLNSIIYHPAVAQFDNIKETCGFYILNNNKTFSHLETFDIGKIYVPQNWLK